MPRLAGARRRPRVIAGVALLGALAVAHAASAQTGSADAQRARFAAAQTSYDERDFEDALAAFRALAEETNSPNAHLYVARTLRELGRLPEAFDAMQRTLREATARASTEAKYAATRDAAAAELALLAIRVGHVVIAVADAADGASVTLDGAPVSADRLGTSITVEPGEHAVTLGAPGAALVRRTVMVSGGETKTIALAAGPAADESAPAAATAPPEPARPEGGGVRVAGLVVGGLGIAALGTGIVTGLLSDADYASLEDTCGTSRCTDPATADTIDRGKTLETISTVGFIGGAALLVAAIPMVVLGGPSESGGETSLVISPGGGALRVRGRF